MLKKLFKPFYTLVIIISILITSFYLREYSFDLSLNAAIIILISVFIENLGYYNDKDNSFVSLSLSICIFILFTFGPLIAILACVLFYTIPPLIEDIKNTNIKILYLKFIKIAFNISQCIINIFIAERLTYYLGVDINNIYDIWKIMLVVLGYYSSNVLLITLIISFSNGKFTSELLSIKQNYNIMFNFILLTPILIYCYYDRGYIGLILILTIIYNMAKSIEVHKKWKAQKGKIFKDELTGVYNFRYFYSIIDNKIKSKKEFSLIIIDIDDFKKINDNYGHVVGDYVLKSIANAMNEVVKDYGILCRHGGDEFSVILNSNEKTFDITSRLLNSINQLTVKYEDNSLKLKASIGYYYYKGDDMTKEELINKADKAMYKVKNSKSKVKICEAI